MVVEMAERGEPIDMVPFAAPASLRGEAGSCFPCTSVALIE
jgi:hypothetical protein